MNDIRPQATLAVTMTAFPSERIVSAVSRLVSEFCQGLVQDVDVAHRFHMAAQELAENLVKYSSGPQVRIEADLVGVDDAARLRLRATNHSTAQQLREVELRLKELTSAEDPVAHYDRLIRETACFDEGSGLGLARIRAEGGLDIDYAIEGNELTISVHTTVLPRESL